MVAFCQKIFPSALGFSLVAALHFGIIVFLLEDRTPIGFARSQSSIMAKIISEPAHINSIKPQINLVFTKPYFEPPTLPGLAVADYTPPNNLPLVKISAGFKPDFDPQIAARSCTEDIRLASNFRLSLSVQIYEDGSVGEVIVERSSGIVELDQCMAKIATSEWRFIPALADGIPVASWQSVQIYSESNSIIVSSR